jgi:hypothetical protein
MSRAKLSQARPRREKVFKTKLIGNDCGKRERLRERLRKKMHVFSFFFLRQWFKFAAENNRRTVLSKTAFLLNLKKQVTNNKTNKT